MFSLIENYGWEFNNTQIARYMAKESIQPGESLDDLELSNWLQEEDDLKLHETKKKYFLTGLKNICLNQIVLLMKPCLNLAPM